MKDPKTREKDIAKQRISFRQEMIEKRKELATMTGVEKIKYDMGEIQRHIKNCEYDLSQPKNNSNILKNKLAFLREQLQRKQEELKQCESIPAA